MYQNFIKKDKMQNFMKFSQKALLLVLLMLSPLASRSLVAMSRDAAAAKFKAEAAQREAARAEFAPKAAAVTAVIDALHRATGAISTEHFKQENAASIFEVVLQALQGSQQIHEMLAASQETEAAALKSSMAEAINQFSAAWQAINQGQNIFESLYDPNKEMQPSDELRDAMRIRQEYINRQPLPYTEVTEDEAMKFRTGTAIEDLANNNKVAIVIHRMISHATDDSLDKKTHEEEFLQPNIPAVLARFADRSWVDAEGADEFAKAFVAFVSAIKSPLGLLDTGDAAEHSLSQYLAPGSEAQFTPYQRQVYAYALINRGDPVGSYPLYKKCYATSEFLLAAAQLCQQKSRFRDHLIGRLLKTMLVMDSDFIFIKPYDKANTPQIAQALMDAVKSHAPSPEIAFMAVGLFIRSCVEQLKEMRAVYAPLSDDEKQAQDANMIALAKQEGEIRVQWLRAAAAAAAEKEPLMVKIGGKLFDIRQAVDKAQRDGLEGAIGEQLAAVSLFIENIEKKVIPIYLSMPVEALEKIFQALEQKHAELQALVGSGEKQKAAAKKIQGAWRGKKAQEIETEKLIKTRQKDVREKQLFLGAGEDRAASNFEREDAHLNRKRRDEEKLLERNEADKAVVMANLERSRAEVASKSAEAEKASQALDENEAAKRAATEAVARIEAEIAAKTAELNREKAALKAATGKTVELERLKKEKNRAADAAKKTLAGGESELVAAQQVVDANRSRLQATEEELKKLSATRASEAQATGNAMRSLQEEAAALPDKITRTFRSAGAALRGGSGAAKAKAQADSQAAAAAQAAAQAEAQAKAAAEQAAAAAEAKRRDGAATKIQAHARGMLARKAIKQDADDKAAAAANAVAANKRDEAHKKFLEEEARAEEARAKEEAEKRAIIGRAKNIRGSGKAKEEDDATLARRQGSMSLDDRVKEAKDRAAARIQAVVRGNKARREVEPMKQAAAAAKEEAAKEAERMKLANEAAAAQKQAAVDEVNSRESAAAERRAREEAEAKAAQEAAAAEKREFDARQRAAERESEVVERDPEARSTGDREPEAGAPDDEAAHRAATKLQALVRGRAARKHVEGLREEKAAAEAAAAAAAAELQRRTVAASSRRR